MYKHWLSAGILFTLLAACSTSPRPEGAVGLDTHSLLGVAELPGDDVSVQAVVPGLTLSVVGRSSVASDGVRVQEMVYEIENTSSRNLSNLTFYPVNTPNTLPNTNVSGLRDALGDEITNPDMAPSIIPVHGQNAEDADMQAFTDADKTRIKTLLDDMYPNNSFNVLSRGFVASNVTGQGNRTIAPGERGVVTIAVQYPYDPANPAGYPASFTLTFAFIDEATPRVTQGDNESNEAFINRVTSTFSSLLEALEIVASDPQNPPSFTAAVTFLEGEKPNPPITQADNLPANFVLTVAGVNITTDANVAIVISPDVQSAVEVQ
jgi:hypothetical protein